MSDDEINQEMKKGWEYYLWLRPSLYHFENNWFAVGYAAAREAYLHEAHKPLNSFLSEQTVQDCWSDEVNWS